MFFKYEIKYFDDIEEKQKIICGLVFEQSYASAISNITDFYGEDCIVYIAIEALERDCPVYETSEKDAE